jgi:pimeloyl-ACP methyl ester carboxylesterase
VPTLLLAGDRDMLCPVDVAYAAYRVLPAGELGIVPDTGHEITSAVIDTMIGFLTRHAER